MTRSTANETDRTTQAVAMLAPHWPLQGRHGHYLALAGGLLRDGLVQAHVEAFVTQLVQATHDDKLSKRLSDAADTARKLANGQKASGWPALVKLLGEGGWQIITEVRRQLGLTINLADLAAHKCLPPDFLAKLGLHDLNFGGVGIPYRDVNGTLVETKRRTQLSAKVGSWWPRSKPVMAYGEERLPAARAAGQLVLVEGESDVWTLLFHEQHALGLPGADTVLKTLHLRHVESIQTLYVVQETDAAGKDFVEHTRQRLGELGWKGTLKKIALGDVKDPSALHCQAPERFREQWHQAVANASVLALATKQATPLQPPTPFQPFPVEALPEPLRTFVTQGAAALGCDVSYLALPALSVVASLIGNSRVIQLKRGWQEPAVIWTGIVGDSGTLKSPAVSTVVGPLYRMQKTLIKQLLADVEQHKQDQEAYNDRKKRAKHAEKEFTEDAPIPPARQRVVTGDVTVEKLAELLEDNAKGLLTCRDELGGWLGSFTRYKGKSGGTDLPNWLELSRAGTVQVDRKTGERPTLFIPRAAVSITGGIQPGALARALTQEYLEVGLGARILLAMPPKLQKRWSDIEIDLEVQQAYEKLLHTLRELPMEPGEDGEMGPFAIRLTPVAKAAWVRFYTEWAKVQTGVEGELAAAYSKLEGYAARFALLHHVVSHVAAQEDCRPIEPASIEAGVTLTKWFAYEAQRIYSGLAETDEQTRLRKLLELLRSWGGASTVRQLQKASGSRYRTTEDAEVALQELVDGELADWCEIPPGPKGGRRTRQCTLRPEKDTTKTDTTSSDEESEDDESDAAEPTQPADTTGQASENHRECGGCVGFGCVGEEDAECENRPAAESARPSNAGVVSEPADRVVSVTTATMAGPHDEPEGQQQVNDKTDTTDTTSRKTAGYRLVTEAGDLTAVCAAVEESTLVGVDCETTGLNPRTDRLRLLTLNCDTLDGGRFTYLVDLFKLDPAPLLAVLAERELILHNALFDLQFLAVLGFEPQVAVHDLLILSRLLTAGRHDGNTLADLTARHLGHQLDKTLQQSDWAGTLTDEQLHYAALDVEFLYLLLQKLRQEIRDAGLEPVAELERHCLPGMLWLAHRGVGFERTSWDVLADSAARESDDLARQLDAAAVPPDDDHLFAVTRNWNSPDEVKRAFQALGVVLAQTDDAALAAVAHPLARLLRDYRSKSKLASTYGTKWYKNACQHGRIHAGWNQLGAASGRMACSKPNLQNLPRDARYRRCFRAPDGRVLIRADYSQIELRIAAKITGDRNLLAAYRDGQDLHTLTAQRVLGLDNVTKADRKIAKALNFGLLFGMSAARFLTYAKSEYNLDLDPGTARRYIDAFFSAYPGLKRWHRQVYDANSAATRTLMGRRRLLMRRQRNPQGEWEGTRHTERLNTPVQGSGADGLKMALSLLWERRGECPDAFPVLVVHDEIVIEAGANNADHAAMWLRQAMLDGMAPLLAPVPVAVDIKIAPTWGEE